MLKRFGKVADCIPDCRADRQAVSRQDRKARGAFVDRDNAGLGKDCWFRSLPTSDDPYTVARLRDPKLRGVENPVLWRVVGRRKPREGRREALRVSPRKQSRDSLKHIPRGAASEDHVHELLQHRKAIIRWIPAPTD
jgi:hypothetical protein